MQGHIESQCRNGVRDERIKAQKEEQAVVEKGNKDEDDFQNLTRRKATKEKKIVPNHIQNIEPIQNNYYQVGRSNQKSRRYNGIVIKKPTMTNQVQVVMEVPGKGKSVTDVNTENVSLQLVHVSNNMDNGIANTKRTNLNTINSEGGSSKDQNKDDNQIQKESRSANETPKKHEQVQTLTKDVHVPHTTPTEKYDHISEQKQERTTHVIDPGEVQNNYLKLISGTSLDLTQNNSPSLHVEHSESSEEDEGSSEDMDYEDEENSKGSGEYASVDNEEDNSDDSADKLAEAFIPKPMEDETLIVEIENVVSTGHLSPRGKGRGYIRGGKISTRERGGKILSQRPVIASHEQKYSR